MSADDGVYILRTPEPEGNGFEFRIAHCQAIENATQPDPDYADDYMFRVFGRSFVLHQEGLATATAHLFHQDLVLRGGDPEYGVQLVEVDRPFPYAARLLW